MGKRLPFWFGFRKNDSGELRPRVFTEHSQDFWSYNKLLIYLACSVCASEMSYFRFSARTSARCARSVLTKNIGPIFHQYRPHARSISSKSSLG